MAENKDLSANITAKLRLTLSYSYVAVLLYVRIYKLLLHRPFLFKGKYYSLSRLFA